MCDMNLLCILVSTIKASVAILPCDGDGGVDDVSSRDVDGGVAKETETIIHVQYMCNYSR